MRVVLDTNVVISGILFGNGPPATIIDLWVDNRLTVLISQILLEEYLEVLLRPKFKRLGTPLERQLIITDLIELDNSVFVYPKTRVKIIEEDPEDNKVLDCAIEGEADYIVSGDTHLLSLKEFQGIPVLSPADFINKFLIQVGF